MPGPTRDACLAGHISDVKVLEKLLSFHGVAGIVEFLRGVTASNSHDDGTATGVVVKVFRNIVHYPGLFSTSNRAMQADHGANLCYE